MRQLLFTYICSLMAMLATAQEVSFVASASRDRIGINERVSVEFKMNMAGDNFVPPSFDGFQVVSGPIQSFAQNWVNGKHSMSKSYRYVLKPSQKGTLTIQQAVVEFEGQEYKTSPLKITVTDATTITNGVSSAQVDQDIHLVAEVSNSSPYLNEPVTVVYKLYVADNTGVSGWKEVDSPKYADFYSQNIDNRNNQVRNGTYNGKPYRYLVLREAVLYPQKEGKLIIEPLTLDINVEMPTSRRDFFGRVLYTTVSKTVSAGKRTINVKPIPMAGRPSSYNGAVGQFDFKLDIDKAQLNAGESLTASLKIGGKGNLKLIEIPTLKVPSSLEMYEPERQNNINTTINGMRGNISDRYVIVPQFGGKYVIPPVEFSYFDPKKEQFITLNSSEQLIDVIGEIASTTTGPAATVKNVIQAKEPFAFIKTSTKLTSVEKRYFYNTLGYWSFFGGALLAIPLLVVFKKRRDTIVADIVGNRLKRANQLSKKYLSEARKNLGDSSQFYVSLEHSLHNYLKAKLRLQTADMSKENVSELLLVKGATADSQQSFISLLTKCELARYTPSTLDSMKEDYELASQTINTIDKQLKK